MLMSNYPNGFANGITIRGIPVTQAHPGKVFWVSNASAAALPGHKGGSNTNDGSFQAPWSTVDYAIGQCVAGRGDIIMVKPGHTENLTAAGAIASDIAGVAIVGLGTGSLVPTFSWTTVVGASWTVTAANCSFINMKFVANLADVMTMFDVSGAADGMSFQDCVFTDTTTNLNAVDFITLATGADDLSWVGCKVIGKSASNDSFITGVAHDRWYMADCQIQFDVAQTAVVGQIETSGNATNVWIRNCFFRSNVDGALHIDFDGAANSGAISNCHFSSLDVAGAVAGAVDFTGGHVFDCLVSGEANLSGITVHGPYVDA
jgi:hypothetical protein